MKAGCVHCKKVENGSNIVYYCELSKSVVVYKYQCSASVKEKEKCPEWGPTLAAEEYYRKISKSNGMKV